MSDTAAFLQMDYDQAVYAFGANSAQAQAAEQAAQEFFKGKPEKETEYAETLRNTHSRKVAINA